MTTMQEGMEEEMSEDQPMKCCFCGKEAESVEHAIQLGWYPDFWNGDVNYQGPVCPECQAEHLFIDDDGEYVLKQGHSVPSLAVRQGFVEVRKKKTISNLIAQPKFQLGQTLATPGALKALEEAGQSPAYFLGPSYPGRLGGGM